MSNVRGKAHVAQRYRVEINGHVFLIAKGDSRYSRWYVLAEDGTYLTSGSKGKHSYAEAVEDAREITRRREELALA